MKNYHFKYFGTSEKWNNSCGGYWGVEVMTFAEMQKEFGRCVRTTNTDNGTWYIFIKNGSRHELLVRTKRKGIYD